MAERRPYDKMIDELLDFGDELEEELNETPRWRLFKRMGLKSALINNAFVVHDLERKRLGLKSHA